jgi:hypothetical protein
MHVTYINIYYYRRLNFAKIKVLCTKLSQEHCAVPGIGPLCSSIKVLVDIVEPYIKDRAGFWHHDHFGPSIEVIDPGDATVDRGPACHCSWYAFECVDPSIEVPAPGSERCGHVHSAACIKCNQLCILDSRLQELISLSQSIIDTAAALPLQADPPHTKLQKQLRNLTWYKDRYNHYIGHQARLCHENAKRKDDLQRLILDPTLIIMTIDLAMKFLSLRYREAMNDWFGKKGIAWQGV